MIEAVNSVLSNAAVTSRVAEQQSNARSYAANPERTQEVAKTPFVSPYISIDRQSNRAVLQIRDSDTGDVVNQFPTEGQLRAYQDAQRASARSERADVISVDNVSSAPQSAPSVQEVSVPTVGTVDTEA